MQNATQGKKLKQCHLTWKSRKAPQREDKETFLIKKDSLQGLKLQQRLRWAETKQEELHGSCSQITTFQQASCSYHTDSICTGARTLARATPTQTLTGEQHAILEWQLILHMLFSWKHRLLAFSATVTKAVGFLGSWLGYRKIWIKVA